MRPLQTSVSEGLLAVPRRNHHRSLQIPPQTARQAERKLPLPVLWKVREIGARGMLPRGSAHRALCLLTPTPPPSFFTKTVPTVYDKRAMSLLYILSPSGYSNAESKSFSVHANILYFIYFH